MSIEKLAQQIFNECEKDGEPVTIEDALEMARMELGAKEIKNYAQKEYKPKEEKEKKPKEIKVSKEKIELFDLLWEGLHNFYDENAQIIKQNKEISVQIGEKSFKIDIVEHRKPKN